jgi:hypothetical protein
VDHNKVGGSAGAAPTALRTGNARSALHGRVAILGNAAFRLVPTPAALHNLRTSGTFERQAPLRSLGAPGAQRQLLQEAQRVARSTSPATHGTANPDPDDVLPGDVGGGGLAHDGADVDRTQGSASNMARGGPRGARSAVDVSEAHQGGARYRLVATQRERQQAYDQSLARSDLPGAQLWIRAREPDATRPALRLLLATALRAAADLSPKPDSLPAPQAAQLAAVRAYLGVGPRDEPALDLAAVKRLLVEVSAVLAPRASAQKPASERRSDLLLLLPLMLLNAERPRTEAQRSLAVGRLALMCSSRAFL